MLRGTALCLLVIVAACRGELACPLVKSVYPPSGTYVDPAERLNFAVTIEFEEPMFLYSYKGRTVKLDLSASEAELTDIFRPASTNFNAAALRLVHRRYRRMEVLVSHRPVSIHSPGNNKIIIVWEIGSMKEIVWKKFS